MDGNPYQSPTGPASGRAPANPYLLTRAFATGFAFNLIADGVVVLLSLFLEGQIVTGLFALVNLLGMPVWAVIALNFRVPTGLESYEDALSMATLIFVSASAWRWIAVAYAAARRDDKEH